MRWCFFEQVLHEKLPRLVRRAHQRPRSNIPARRAASCEMQATQQHQTMYKQHSEETIQHFKSWIGVKRGREGALLIHDNKRKEMRREKSREEKRREEKSIRREKKREEEGWCV
jgi:hypothetical protein